jgi:hypothetical protein
MSVLTMFKIMADLSNATGCSAALSVAVAMPWPGGVPQEEEINADGTAGGLVGLPLLQPLSRYRPPRPEVQVARRRIEVRPAEEGLRQKQMQDILALVRDSDQLQRDMAAAKGAGEAQAAAPNEDFTRRPLYAPAYGIAVPYGYSYVPQMPEPPAEEQGGVEGGESEAGPVRWADQDHSWAMRGKKQAPPPRPLTVDASVSYSRALEAAATAQEAAAFSPSAQVGHRLAISVSCMLAYRGGRPVPVPTFKGCSWSNLISVPTWSIRQAPALRHWLVLRTRPNTH